MICSLAGVGAPEGLWTRVVALKDIDEIDSCHCGNTRDDKECPLQETEHILKGTAFLIAALLRYFAALRAEKRIRLLS